MKRKIIAAFVVIAGAATFFSCTKKKDSSSTPAFVMTATINGSAFNGDSCLFSPYTQDSSYYINAGGGYAGKPDIDLYLFKYRGVGTYNLYTSNSVPSFSGDYSDGSALYTNFSSGSVTIISASSTVVTGTFSFTANLYGGTGSVTVTNGSFTAQVQ